MLRWYEYSCPDATVAGSSNGGKGGGKDKGCVFPSVNWCIRDRTNRRQHGLEAEPGPRRKEKFEDDQSLRCRGSGSFVDRGTKLQACQGGMPQA
jgi:hypothetical protein